VSVSGGSVDVRDAMRIAAELFDLQRLTADLADRFMDAINNSVEIESSPYSNVDSPLVQDGGRLKLG
jgi:hypothetical protein